tara:strand:+ start:3535 stop:4188 length:654 start_codon:yes stop_codon:yes gene_type:complete
MNTELENLLIEYAKNTEDPKNNFNLGICYESIGHTAPALSYFLRCAERTDDDLLAYEALIHGAICYQSQGGRDMTAKTLYQHAMLLLPERPEAYGLLSRFCREREQMQDAYIYADTGLRCLDNDHVPLQNDCEYQGKNGLLFDKAVSGWTWGKVDETVGILYDLYKSPDVEYSNRSKKALKEFGKWNGDEISLNDLTDPQIESLVNQLIARSMVVKV